MIILDEVKHDLSVLGPEVKDIGEALAIPANSQRYEELTQKSSEPGFFDDQENSRRRYRGFQNRPAPRGQGSSLWALVIFRLFEKGWG